MSDFAVSFQEIVKIYEDKCKNRFCALDKINLQIPKGSFFALLGPNGAGKSTLINILAGTVKKTTGKITAMGYDLDVDVKAAKKLVGVVPQEIAVDTFFTVRETLEFYAGYYGVRPQNRKTDEILDALGLSDKAEQYPRQLSGGMKRRLLVAKAIVHSPQILILDEPTAGVDIELREQLWEYVKSLNEQGMTIILTTHYLEEAEQLCTDFAFITQGKLSAIKTKDKINNMLDEIRKFVIVFDERDQELVKQVLLKKKDFFPEAVLNDYKLTVSLEGGINVAILILKILHDNSIRVKDLSIIRPNLDTIFRQIIKPS